MRPAIAQVTPRKNPPRLRLPCRTLIPSLIAEERILQSHVEIRRIQPHANYTVFTNLRNELESSQGHWHFFDVSTRSGARFGGGALGAGFRAQGGLPVVNVAGCPTHPGWVVDTLIALGLGELRASDLDALGRPRFYAEKLVHHGCARNEFYEFKASAEKPSDLGCMMEHMGCKGTQAHADCNVRTWNGEGSCLRGGFPCVSCTEPGFEEPGHPFTQTPKVAGIPIGLPSDMPKAWFVALGALSKSATPRRVRENAVSFRQEVPPAIRKTGLK